MSIELATSDYQPVLNGNVLATGTIPAGHAIGADGAVAGAGVDILGIALSDYVAGQQAAYVAIGKCGGVVGAAVGAALTELTPNAAGRLVPATSTDVVVAKALTTGAADGDVIELLVFPGGIKA